MENPFVRIYGLKERNETYDRVEIDQNNLIMDKMDFSVIEGKPSNPRGELMNQLNDLMDYYDADDYSYEQGPGEI